MKRSIISSSFSSSSSVKADKLGAIALGLRCSFERAGSSVWRTKQSVSVRSVVMIGIRPFAPGHFPSLEVYPNARRFATLRLGPLDFPQRFLAARQPALGPDALHSVCNGLKDLRVESHVAKFDEKDMQVE